MQSRTEGFKLYLDGFGYGRWSLRLSNFSLKKLVNPLIKMASFFSFINQASSVQITNFESNGNHYQFRLNEVSDNKDYWKCYGNCRSSYYNISKWLENNECNMTYANTTERFYEPYLSYSFVLKIYKSIYEIGNLNEKCMHSLVIEADYSDNITQCDRNCRTDEEVWRNINMLILIGACIGTCGCLSLYRWIVRKCEEHYSEQENNVRLLDDFESNIPKTTLKKKNEPTFEERLEKIGIHSTSEVISEEFFDPISKGIMNDPVILMETGQSYDRRSISQWLNRHNTDPLTGLKLSSTILTTNVALKGLIDKFVLKLEQEFENNTIQVIEHKL